MISQVKLEPIGKDEIIKLSTIEVKIISDLQSNKFGASIDNPCFSCKKISECPGHFGFLNLKNKIFHPLLKNILINAMNLYCTKCEYIVKKSPCPNCNTYIKKMDKTTKGYLICPRETLDILKSNVVEKELLIENSIITAQESDKIMKNVAKKAIKINDKDIYKLATKARCGIIKYLLIPPKYLRTSDYDSNLSSESNGLYEKLVKYVSSYKPDPWKIYKLVSKVMGIHEIKFNKLPNQKGIIDTLSGKKSIFRKYSLGKRVDNSGRAVITGEPNIPMNVVVLPSKIAKNISIKEIVDENNIEKLRNMAKLGILKKHEKIIYDADIYQGTIIKRNIIDNDLVIFNRQPTLTKASIMVFKAKLAKDNRNVISFNQLVSFPFNADFDGDEMNIYAFYSNNSIELMKTKMMPINNIISPIGTFPIIKASKDTIMGIYLLTKYEHNISKNFVNDIIVTIEKGNLLYSTKFITSKCKNKIQTHNSNYNGKLLISMAFSDKFNYNENNVEIKNGILKKGVIDDKILNKGKNSILFKIYKHLGAIEANNFLEILQKITNKWLYIYGFSVGYDDCRLSIKGINKINKIINDLIFKSKSIIKNNDEYESEITIKILLINLITEAEKIQKKYLLSKNMMDIVESGARGNIENINCITSFVGQQEVNENIENAINISDKGFCKSSYSGGLSRKEFLFHQMSAREGLIRTYIGTSESGYLSRRARICMGDVKILDGGNIVTDKKIIKIHPMNDQLSK